jgi:hypothetical protein
MAKEVYSELHPKVRTKIRLRPSALEAITLLAFAITDFEDVQTGWTDPSYP